MEDQEPVQSSNPMPCTCHYFPPPEDDGYDADIEDKDYDVEMSDDPGCNVYEADSDECDCDSDDSDSSSDYFDSDDDDSDSSSTSDTSLEDRQSALDTPNIFGEIQRSGAELQDCMDYPNRTCHIQPCTLSMSHLSLCNWQIEIDDREIPMEIESQASFLGLRNWGRDYIHTSLTWYTDGVRNMWEGRTGHGAIFLEDIVNSPDSNGPYISQITQAVYQQHWDLADLTSIYVLNVVERETTRFVSQILPTGGHEYAVLEYGTAEFQGLLGTRIGRVVAYFVLGAYERGTARVSRVCMWRDSMFLQMQFVIEIFNEPEVDLD